MAQYSRQVNLDTEITEDRTLSPTCEVLSEDARSEDFSHFISIQNVRRMFVSPSLKYRMRSTSLWRGRSGLEKVLMVCLSVLLLLLCTFIVVLIVLKQVSSVCLLVINTDSLSAGEV